MNIFTSWPVDERRDKYLHENNLRAFNNNYKKPQRTCNRIQGNLHVRFPSNCDRSGYFGQPQTHSGFQGMLSGTLSYTLPGLSSSLQPQYKTPQLPQSCIFPAYKTSTVCRTTVASASVCWPGENTFLAVLQDQGIPLVAFSVETLWPFKGISIFIHWSLWWVGSYLQGFPIISVQSSCRLSGTRPGCSFKFLELFPSAKCSSLTSLCSTSVLSDCVSSLVVDLHEISEH